MFPLAPLLRGTDLDLPRVSISRLGVKQHLALCRYLTLAKKDGFTQTVFWVVDDK